jgi:hypothetical protein
MRIDIDDDAAMMMTRWQAADADRVSGSGWNQRAECGWNADRE